MCEEMNWNKKQNQKLLMQNKTKEMNDHAIHACQMR